MDWKTNIISQIKTKKYHYNIYEEIITHYNRLLETNLILQTQNSKLNHDIEHLRLTNSALEKASQASQNLVNVNDRLHVANEELMMHLREKGELAREVLRLNHVLTDLNEKLLNEEIKVKQYRNENDLLTKKIDNSEAEVNELVQINEVIREELVAIQIKFDQLQAQYMQLNPTLIDVQLQLEKEKRLSQQLEEQLIESKRVQVEMLDAEVKRFDNQNQGRNIPNSIEDDRISISSSRQHSNVNTASPAGDDRNSVLIDETKRSRTNSIGGANIITNIRRMFAPGTVTTANDSYNRTSTFCISASVPTRELNHWDCTDLEVYALQFQPSGSLLATGCSDKMIHLWQISPSGHPRRYGSLQGSAGAINALDFDSESFRLIAGCSSDKAYIWSYNEHHVPKDTITGHSDQIYTCKFISGNKLATGGADRLIKVWDLQSRQCTRTLFTGSKCHDLVVIDAAGTIISGHFNRKIRIWDPFTDQYRTELQCNATITSLSYNAEKQQLLACLKDETLQLIDLRQNRVLLSMNNDNFEVRNDTNKAILSPDGRYACAGSFNGSVIIWNTTDGTCEKVLHKKHTTMVTSVAWHPEGRYVASCEKHRQVILWSD